MKAYTIAILSVISGVVVGLLITAEEWRQSDDPAARLVITSDSMDVVPLEHSPGLGHGSPKVSVDGGEIHDFGAMEYGTTGSHTYVFRNDGDSVLLIETKSTDCKCTISNLEEAVIPPDSSVGITLEWTPASLSRNFEQGAEIATNDPARPVVQLTVQGRVLQTFFAVPEQLSLQRISVSKAHRFRIVIYNYRASGAQITGFALSHPESAKYFDVKLGKELTEQEHSAEPYAQGAEVIVVTIRPGLPLGPLQQKIRLQTSVEELPQIEIPIRGTVVSDISIVGRSFRGDSNTLHIGTIRSQQGVRFQLYILVKGPHRESVDLTVGQVDPADILCVSLGQRDIINDGLVHKYPLTIDISPGSGTTSRLGTERSPYGEIRIDTTHPQAKVVPVYVKFAIQG